MNLSDSEEKFAGAKKSNMGEKVMVAGFVQVTSEKLEFTSFTSC